MSEVLRTDLLDHGMNAGKEQAVKALLRAWRSCAVLVGREQWRLFHENGRVNKMHRSPTEADLAAVVGAANRLQMVRYQVVGILDSYLANRQNEFARIVECSTLPADMKHQLHFVNRWKAWFGRDPLTMKDESEIPSATRALARRIMRQVLSKHRPPDFSRINMVIDQRAATLREAEGATAFDLWIRLSTMDRGQPIEIPLRAHDYFASREGERKKSVQVNERGGRLFFGIDIEYVNPAYSSQECSACGYVDRKNRASEKFSCRWCGSKLHVDVNAPRNLRSRRSRPAVGSVKQAKAAVLRVLVLDFQRRNVERWGTPQGRRGTSRDPREQNACFVRYAPKVTSSRLPATSALAACATKR